MLSGKIGYYDQNSRSLYLIFLIWLISFVNFYIRLPLKLSFILGLIMSRNLKYVTRLVEVGQITRKGRHFIDVNENPLHGIYHAEQESAAHTIVFIHGVCVADYGYPRIERKFFSPMINDFNLHFIGRWRWPFENEGEALVERIAACLKPAGLITMDKELAISLEQKARDVGLEVVTHDDEDRGVRYLGFAIHGKFNVSFDLERLVADYKTYEQVARFSTDDLDIETVVGRVENDTIISHVGRYLCLNPGVAAGIITCGLIFGYPIETTVAFLSGKIE